MKSRIVAWLDARLIRDWRVAAKLWSVRVNLIIGAIAIVVTILSLVSDEVKELIGWKAFAGGFFALSMVGLVARLTAQDGGKGDDDA